MTKKDQTATELLLEAQWMTRDDSRYCHMVEDFIQNWGPNDLYAQTQFSASLMGLQRRMWLDASSPDKRTLDALMKALATNVRPPSLIIKEQLEEPSQNG